MNPEYRIVHEEADYRHTAYLPFPKKRKYIRPSHTKHHLVFVFADQTAAEAWSDCLVLGDLEAKYKEVWIKEE